jgi:hypothetical protein
MSVGRASRRGAAEGLGTRPGAGRRGGARGCRARDGVRLLQPLMQMANSADPAEEPNLVTKGGTQ